jgi:signal transduction histidine kinase/ActR/RegA family two-component response regulator
MKIRNQLLTLVLGILLPLVLLAAYLTYQLCEQQRDGYQQQFLERASAVRLALDTEFAATFRALRATGDGSEIPQAYADTVLSRRFRRALDSNLDWAAIGLLDPQGRLLLSASRPGEKEPPALSADGIRAAKADASELISGLVSTTDGKHLVYLATRVTRDGATAGWVYAAVDHSHWLQLLGSYPVSKRGILTLMDGSGAIVARTLNDPQWVGKRAPASYLSRIAGQGQGAFETIALDGRPFYAAFSRSLAGGWVLSTGVPREEVDQALYWNGLMVLLVCATAILGASLAAWRLGKQINDAMVGLLQTARTLVDKEVVPVMELPINEARTIRDALVNSRELLRSREESLNEALAREEKARQQAESASHAKNQFVAMLGHELRNPVSAITAAVDLLGTGGASQTALARSREIIRRQTGHLAAMIKDLMDVAELDTNEIALRSSVFDLAQVAVKVQSRFEDTGRCAHLQIRTSHAPAWIHGDEARVELLMTCLLDNACKYTPPGGTVTIEVVGDVDSSVLRIVDTGVGFEPGSAERMFEAFAQGQRGIERSQGGLGLGLAIAKRLALAHDAVIVGSSEGPGLGAHFEVRFPAAAAPAPEAVEPVKELSSEILITIVEDIPDNREALELLLEAQGRRINAADDGPSGVELILQGPSDLALIDIGLPGFDGLEVARRVRLAPGGSQVVLVALTGYGTPADRARAADAGFDEFFVKPFDPDLLEGVLQRVAAAKAKAHEDPVEQP